MKVTKLHSWMLIPMMAIFANPSQASSGDVDVARLCVNYSTYASEVSGLTSFVYAADDVVALQGLLDLNRKYQADLNLASIVLGPKASSVLNGPVKGGMNLDAFVLECVGTFPCRSKELTGVLQDFNERILAACAEDFRSGS